MIGKCRFCGNDDVDGTSFDKWVKPTFTDFDKLQPGEIVCDSCMFFFNEQSQELAERMGKDKPQRMRNYSHFIVNGKWIPSSKGSKTEMLQLLLGDSFPELAAIADSGQKHIVFRSIRNAPGSKAGWVQFEEQRIFLVPDELRALLFVVESLYVGFSKAEIESGEYAGWRIMKFGVNAWDTLESQIKSERGKPIFSLALFLAQKEENDDGTGSEEQDGGAARGDMARDSGGVQAQVQPIDLDSIREPSQECGVHKQYGAVSQPNLFET